MSFDYDIVIKPEPERPRHPCYYGHRWAWAYLTRGGTVQVCRVCGLERK